MGVHAQPDATQRYAYLHPTEGHENSGHNRGEWQRDVPVIRSLLLAGTLHELVQHLRIMSRKWMKK